MIEKWYCIRCDNCGELMNYWQTYSALRALELEKENNVERFRITSSSQFCSEECQKDWQKKKKKKKEREEREKYRKITKLF